jgi:hypothetical protein
MEELSSSADRFSLQMWLQDALAAALTYHTSANDALLLRLARVIQGRAV